MFGGPGRRAVLQPVCALMWKRSCTLDCADGADEMDCNFNGAHCNNQEFPCLSGQCIPASRKCDHKPDCASGEDEVACSAECEPEEFLCREGKCIQRQFICDGTEDCGEGDDEVRLIIFVETIK